MFGLGSQELLVILVIVLIMFGANRLPQIARLLGSSLKEFKKEINEGQAEDINVPRESRQRMWEQCKNSLEADWTHCPRCETALAKEAAPESARGDK